MDAPSAPPTPNPYAVAAAQQNANISVAIANTILGNASEVHPQGTVDYTITGYFSLTDPTYDQDGNQTGETIRSIPMYRRTVAYTSAEQSIFNTEQSTRAQMATIALSQASRISSAISSPVTTAGLTTAVAAPSAPSLASAPTSPTLDTSATSVPTQPSAPSVRSLPSAPSVPTLTTSAVSAPSLPSTPSTPTLTTSAPAAPTIDGMMPDAGPVWDLIGSSDFAEAKNTVIDAVKARLDYQIGLDRESIIARLTNQGVSVGDEAYDNEMNLLSFRENDAQTQAVLAGGQEQSRLFQLELARAQFYNAAQSQRFQQLSLTIEISNRAAVQTFEYGARAASVSNELAMQVFNANLSVADFSRASALSLFETQIRAADVGNQRLLQQFGASMDAVSMTSKLALEAYQQDANTVRISSELLDKNFTNTLQATDARNRHLVQNFLSAMQAMQASNAALVQQYQVGRDRADFSNTTRERELQEQLVVRNQPLNEIATMLRGSQLALPQFKQYNAGTIANTPVGEYVYRSAEMDMKKFDTAVKQQSAMIGAIASVAGSVAGAGMGAPAGGGWFDQFMKR